jgi:hypothetical protein
VGVDVDIRDASKPGTAAAFGGLWQTVADFVKCIFVDYRRFVSNRCWFVSHRSQYAENRQGTVVRLHDQARSPAIQPSTNTH